jgi:hypothetical protein
MENQELLESNENATNDLIIDNYSKDNLEITAKWAQILAIIGFIGIGFLAISGILNFYTLNFLEDDTHNEVPFNFLNFIKIIIPIVYFVIAGILYYPIQKLYDFSKFTKRALYNHNQNDLIATFENQRKFYKFIGIFSIVWLIITVVTTLILIFYMIFKYIK